MERIAHYKITRKLGEGGMGVVYAADDERLGRQVAIKAIRAGVADTSARERLWREARTAASLNHPNVCQLYEVVESEGELFLAMELLDGESLADRIARGPLAVADAGQIALAMLDALAPLHQRGILHRDLKPSNVFLTERGVKLLDFGLARAATANDQPALTQPDMVVGTPNYLSPEQLAGKDLDGRSDLFAVGAVLYEMLSGRQAFGGRALPQIFNAIVNEEPPQLGGSDAVASLERVIRRALAKRPERRYANAEAMTSDLRVALLLAGSSGALTRAQPLRRLIVLPFRALRDDDDTNFLAFSLPDAISSSLTSLDSIVVRSTLAAARLKLDEVDLAEVAEKADVDIVLTGTLLRAGDQLRVTNQLVDAHNGAVIWTQTSQVSLGDIFQLQDSLTRRIVESLQVPLTAHDEKALRQDVPADPKAYELYLRANRHSLSSARWVEARDLYLECLAIDPGFAPAWARLGRLYRLLSQFSSGDQAGNENHERALQAFRRALEINPDLPIAHHLYTNLEVDMGKAEEAMVRLIHRAAEHPTDAELFAGLVQSCRYCGLLEPAIAAHEHAVRLDPGVRTSIHHAHLMRSNYDAAIRLNVDDPPMIVVLALDLSGRRPEAIEACGRIEEQLPGMMKDYMRSLRFVMEERKAEARAIIEAMLKGGPARDPCARYYTARLMAGAGVEGALAMLASSIDGGFSCFDFMARDPWLAALRGQPEFSAILRRSEARERHARAAYIEAGGDRVLGVDA